MTLSNIVRLNIYTTDVDAAFFVVRPRGERLAPPACCHRARFSASPAWRSRRMVELEATGVAWPRLEAQGTYGKRVVARRPGIARGRSRPGGQGWFANTGACRRCLPEVQRHSGVLRG